jgi:hypothetical protein
MSMDQAWPESLKRAREKLEQTPAAPPWLAQALRAAEAGAAALAPEGPREDAAPEFYYPH